LKIFAIFEMNTLATVYCCLGGVKMCMAAVEGEKNNRNVFLEKNQANTFYKSYK